METSWIQMLTAGAIGFGSAVSPSHSERGCFAPVLTSHFHRRMGA